MNDFPLFGDSFDICLKNIKRVLVRCEEINLVLCWDKWHYIVPEGIVLEHTISQKGIEVDKAKVTTIEKLPQPHQSRQFILFGTCRLLQNVIKDFSPIARHLTKLLEKDKLVQSPIMITPYWNLSFQLMCIASYFIVGAVLGQRNDKHFHPIYYTRRTLNDSQENYTTTKKKLLTVIFAFDKF